MEQVFLIQLLGTNHCFIIIIIIIIIITFIHIMNPVF